MKSVKAWAAFLVIFFCFQSFSKVGADLIAESCAKTSRSDLCERSLRSNPRAPGAKDAKGLTRIVYDSVLSDATDTLAQVRNLLNGATDAALRNYLTICSNGYVSIVSDKVPNARKNLDSNSYVTAASLMSDAMFQAQICERSFSIGPDVRASPLTDKNTKVINQSDIAMRLTTSLG